VNYGQKSLANDGIGNLFLLEIAIVLLANSFCKLFPEACYLKRSIVTSLAVIIIVASVFATQLLLPLINTNSNQGPPMKKPGFHVGVSFGDNTTAEAKLLIDKVKNFTNLFVVQSGPVSVNETALDEIVDYAVASGLDVIVYFGYFNPAYPWQRPWLDYAKQTWGNHFLGVYLNDEPGGQTLDVNWTGYFNQIRIRNTSIYYEHVPAIDLALNGSLPIDNNQAAYHFLTSVETGLGLNELKTRSITAFTADYALYWFDYQGGYDTVFAEFGSNQSITQTIALARGAARMQNKIWGTIITWTYDEPPYLVDGAEMYNQLLTAYMSGAKYAVIFDYPQIPGNPYGILTDAHFTALEKFWSKIQSLTVNNQPEAVLVLPHDYGWGMRNPNEPIWGLWAPDGTSAQIWSITQKLLTRYGTGLDIVYDDAQFPVAGKGYQQVYFWNQTV
jgi:hypothetical protein